MIDQKPRRLVRSFHAAVKPVGSRCNIDCTYCYYLHKQGLLNDTTASPMSDELLEEFIRQYLVGQDTDSVTFTWHGGEPMLLGLDFYRRTGATAGLSSSARWSIENRLSSAAHLRSCV